MQLTENQKGYLKVLMVLAFVILIIIGFALKNTYENPSPEKTIIGHWVLTDDENNNYVRMINDYFPEDAIYFYEDGQMSMNGSNCTYSIVGNELTISSFFGGTQYYEIIISDNEMTLKRTIGTYNGTTAYYEKVS